MLSHPQGKFARVATSTEVGYLLTLKPFVVWKKSSLDTVKKPTVCNN